jgi:hypothetical protein
MKSEQLAGIMATATEDLRRNLQTIIRQGISVDAGLFLKDILERGELSYRTDAEQQVWAWWPKDPSLLLDRIAGIEDESQQPGLELFAWGFTQFTVGDRGSGLDIYWQLRDRGNPQ